MTKTSAINRIHELLDDNSFVEVGAYITARSTDYNMQSQETPADGVVTGYGTINGALVYVYSQDASVMGGSIGEMHAKKIEKLYSMAMKMGAPIVALVDCAGFRLQESMDALDGFGKLYVCQAMASGVIPQIQAVFGNCGGGMAVASEMADFTFMEQEAKMFVNAPFVIAENDADNSSAEYQAKETGNVCGTGSEEEILGQIRQLIGLLPSNFEDNDSFVECTDDLNRTCDDITACAGDTSIALSMISDDSFYMEMKKDYAPEMVTAFIRLNGATVGCVANRSEVYNAEGEKAETFDNVLSVRGCKKAADFVKFCDAFELPVLTLTNVKGYKATKCSEANIAKAAASLTYAFANATVPKVNVVVGEAFGSAYLTMNSKSTGADMVFAWPESQIGMMDAKLAAKIMYADSDAATINEKAAEYAQLQSSALSAAKRGYVDTIIEPEDTRKYVIGAFEMLFTKRENRPSKKHGTV